MAQTVLELSVLQEMFGDDKALIGAILLEFKHSALPYMEELRQALSQKNTGGVKSLAHKLKSSSRTIGASALGLACEHLETEAANSDWTAIEAISREVQVLLADVVDAVDAHIQ